jgi:hypothetical protein
MELKTSLVKKKMSYLRTDSFGAPRSGVYYGNTNLGYPVYQNAPLYGDDSSQMRIDNVMPAVPRQNFIHSSYAPAQITETHKSKVPCAYEIEPTYDGKPIPMGAYQECYDTPYGTQCHAVEVRDRIATGSKIHKYNCDETKLSVNNGYTVNTVVGADGNVYRQMVPQGYTQTTWSNPQREEKTKTERKTGGAASKSAKSSKSKKSKTDEKQWKTVAVYNNGYTPAVARQIKIGKDSFYRPYPNMYDYDYHPVLYSTPSRVRYLSPWSYEMISSNSTNVVTKYASFPFSEKNLPFQLLSPQSMNYWSWLQQVLQFIASTIDVKTNFDTINLLESLICVILVNTSASLDSLSQALKNDARLYFSKMNPQMRSLFRPLLPYAFYAAPQYEYYYPQALESMVTVNDLYKASAATSNPIIGSILSTLQSLLTNIRSVSGVKAAGKAAKGKAAKGKEMKAMAIARKGGLGGWYSYQEYLPVVDAVICLMLARYQYENNKLLTLSFLQDNATLKNALQETSLINRISLDLRNYINFCLREFQNTKEASVAVSSMQTSMFYPRFARYEPYILS